MKIFLPFLVAIIVIAGCTKSNKCNFVDSTVTAPPAEIQQLKDSLDLYGITATQHASGFFYKINAAGSGTGVSNLCTTVAVTYKGQFFNGKVFDSTETGLLANFQLGEVIVGWQKGVPLVSKGGNIDLYIPPSLAYGAGARRDNLGNIVIPANSYLIFNVHVVDIQ
ncbi:MAG: FKBP-type peptidyl-prolyl cis-trans isomerase [Bacteroidota bacterium]|nr:FKBP-type peptidyl-prolyl cis-trans isomerase [Bacteroidota bacterium]